MNKYWFSKAFLISVMMISVLFAMTACGEKEQETETVKATESTLTEAEVEQDFILVGSDNGEPLIFYNLNAVTSVEELEEYIDLSYDFENKPELLFGQVEAPEGVFEEIQAMLDEKGVVYTIIEDTE